MRRRFTAALAAAALVLSACSAGKPLTVERLDAALDELATDSGQTTFHQVLATQFANDEPVVQLLGMGPDGPHVWGTGTSGKHSVALPELPGGRGFDLDQVPRDRLVSIAQRYDECTSVEITYQQTPAGTEAFDAVCAGDLVPARSWLGEDELPRLDSAVTAEAIQQLHDEIARVVPDGRVVWWSYDRAMNEQGQVFVVGAKGPMGRAEDCHLVFTRALGPESSALDLTMCRQSMELNPPWPVLAVSGRQVADAIEQAAAEIPTSIESITSLTVRSEQEGTLQVEVIAPGGTAKAPVG